MMAKYQKNRIEKLGTQWKRRQSNFNDIS